MIDITDPRNQHLISHPHFLSGIEHERERIIAIMYAQLAYYNKQIDGAKSLAFQGKMEDRKKGIIEAIKLARMTDMQAAEVFRKKETK
jgi:hypothetical protein